MTPQRVDGVILDEADQQVVVYAIRLAQRARARDGLPPLRQFAQLAAACTPPVSDPVTDPGQSDSPNTALEHDGQQQTTSGQVVGITEAAALLGVSPRTARRLAPRLDGRRTGGVWTIPRDALDDHQNGTRA